MKFSAIKYNLERLTLLWIVLLFTPLAFGSPDDSYSDNDNYQSHQDKHWVGTWATAPQSSAALLPPFENQTLRQIVRISVGGKALRVWLSNVKGSEPLKINAASVGKQELFEDIKPQSLRELTFGGEPSVTIPVGAKVLSDPVRLRVRNEANLAISLYVEDLTLAETQHTNAFQTSYYSDGNATQDADMDAFGTTQSWFFLTGVDVLKGRDVRAVVALGDSITDGFFTTADANNRWPDVLARRLLNERKGKHKMGVLNVGIGGNRILNDFLGFGSSALARLDQDVLTQTGVTHVILLEGINDIGIPNIPPEIFPLPPEVLAQQVAADDVIAGMKQIITRAHARGLKIFGATILPYKTALYFTETGEQIRQDVNAWIRHSGEFDGVIDFDAAIRDPADPEMMRPEFDSGDNLHPNDAGMEAMANAIDLKLFRNKHHLERSDH